MNYKTFSLTGMVLLNVLVGPASFAQRQGGTIPQVGSDLPVVQVNKENGQVFSTSQLKGSYTVLVFGCLT